jgi:hypothetical protein
MRGPNTKSRCLEQSSQVGQQHVYLLLKKCYTATARALGIMEVVQNRTFCSY